MAIESTLHGPPRYLGDALSLAQHDQGLAISPLYSLRGKRAWVAGHRGMVGSALLRRLAEEDCELLTVDREALDLRDISAVRRWTIDRRPDVIFMAAAKVGGIVANSSQPVQFLQDNLLLSMSVIGAAEAAQVEKLLYLGSSCIYPRMALQPISEAALMTGVLEPTNEAYAIAKIVGIMLANAYRRQHGCDMISAMPTNLYGPGDNYDLASSHVVPALIRKVDQAKRNGGPVVVWGTGSPRREFMYVDDCADACVHLMKHYSGDEHINVGSGEERSILELTRLVMDVVGYDGPIAFDATRPDGTPRKLLDVSRLTELGWQARVSLREGLERSYTAYLTGARREIALVA